MGGGGRWLAALSGALAALCALAPAAFAWSEPETLVQLTAGPAENQIFHVTVMPVRGKLGDPHDSFYMWTWTHDARSVELYSAPAVEGPWTHRSTDRIGYPDDYGLQVSAGDVVWDPRTKGFIASPHSVHSDPYHQTTFMVSSRDGERWSYVRRDEPAIEPGDDGAFDNVHAGYGRFLRRSDGTVVRRAGRLTFYYRGAGSRRDDGRLGAVVSREPGALGWRKVNGGRPLFDPGGSFHFANDAGYPHYYLGSALQRGNGVELFASVRNIMCVKRSRSAFDWASGHGRKAFVDRGAYQIQGGSFVRTKETQYLVYGAAEKIGDGEGEDEVASSVRFVSRRR